MIDIYLLAIYSSISSVFSLLLCFDAQKKVNLLISPCMLFVFFHVVLVQIGSVVYLFEPELLLHTLNVRGIDDCLKRYAYWMATGVVLFSMSNYLVTCNFVSRKPGVFDSEALVVERLNGVYWHSFFLSLLSIVSLFLYFYYVRGSFPIFEAFLQVSGDDVSSLSTARSDSTYVNPIPGYLLQLIRTVNPLLLLMMVFSIRFKSKLKFALVFITFVITLFFVAINGERSYAVIYFLFIGVTYFNSNREKVDFKKVFYMMLLLLLMFVLMTVLLGRAGSQGDSYAVLDELVHRIFLSQSQTGSYIFQLYPDVFDFKGAVLYWDNFATYLPGDAKSYSVELFHLVHGRAGSASHSSFAEAYAAFGGGGIVIFALLWGGGMAAVASIYSQTSKSVLKDVTFSMLTVILAITSLGSVTGIFYAGGLAVVVMYGLFKLFYSVNRRGAI